MLEETVVVDEDDVVVVIGSLFDNFKQFKIKSKLKFNIQYLFLRKISLLVYLKFIFPPESKN